MRSPKVIKEEYIGYGKPENPQEIEVEIAGLEHLIAKANVKIAELKQAMVIAKMVIESDKTKC
jgi:hypothetical protein